MDDVFNFELVGVCGSGSGVRVSKRRRKWALFRSELMGKRG